MVPPTRQVPELGFVHAADHLEQGTLAAAVQADQAVEVAGHDLEGHIPQRIKFIKLEPAFGQGQKIFFRLSCFSLDRLKRMDTWSPK